MPTQRSGVQYITIVTMGQNIFILLAFLTDGMQKGVIAVASNLIGAKKQELLSTLIQSALKMHAVIMLIAAVPLLLFPEVFVDTFEIDMAAQDIGKDIIFRSATFSQDLPLLTRRNVYILGFFLSDHTNVLSFR